MSKDKVKTAYNTEVLAIGDQQSVGREPSGVPAATSTPRPWTADFLLPSIRYREPSAPKIKAH